MMDTYHYTFVQTHRMYNLNVNYGLWVIMMCQHRFISCSKCTTLVSGVDNGGGYARVGQGVYGKSLYPPLNFAMNLKLL